MNSDPHIFLIAGEASGDLLGGRLMEALKIKSSKVQFSGIGGENMEKQGLHPIFPMDDLSVMGIAEVLPKLSLLLARISETVNKIMTDMPDAVVTIDAPDFSFRVAKKLRKKGYKGKIMHYVAPSVWAWRPGRAKKISAFLDHLFCLLPFEPPYFEKHGLAASYIGHSIVESNILKGQADFFKSNHDIKPNERVVLLLPGSRQGELDRHLDLFLKTAESLSGLHSNLRFAVPTLPRFKQRIHSVAADKALDIIVTTDEMEKYNAFAAADFAIAASGTVAIELAYANVPSVVSYRMNWLTGVLARILVKTDYAALPNIILQDEVMPEFLLKNANLENLVNVSDCYLSNETFPQMQKSRFETIRAELQANQTLPSEKAAEIILQTIS